MCDIWRMYRPLPAGKGVVSQLFGERPEVYARFGMAGHNGIDYVVPIGTPVLAAHSGTVEIGDDPQGYGLYVRIVNEHAITIYAHLSAIIVKVGDQVLANDQIGLSGNSGFSTGPHLHWGLKWRNGDNPAYRGWVDPLPFRRWSYGK